MIFLVYPQWRVIKYLFRYYAYHKSETQLEEEKAAYERDVASLEPFLESLWQGGTFHIRIQHLFSTLYFRIVGTIIPLKLFKNLHFLGSYFFRDNHRKASLLPKGY